MAIRALIEREIKTLLGIPDRIKVAALVTLGRPARRYGPPRRIPAAERTHWDRWDQRAPRDAPSGGRRCERALRAGSSSADRERSRHP